VPIPLRPAAPRRIATALTAIALTALTIPTLLVTVNASAVSGAASDHQGTTTPIQHVVVVFQENIPFDHYFGTYPHAANLPGEPRFTARPGTPSVNGYTDALLNDNPNSANPHRFTRDEPNICGSNHGYTAEQKAYDMGLVDRFVEETGNHGPGCDGTHGMGYFDGNTVTALWNYAQHFAMSDNSYGTTYGPSHIGVLNLVSGQTHGAVATGPTDDIVDGTMIANVEPSYDDCPVSPLSAHMTGRNIGNLLNDHHITWGWFSDGFKPTSRLPDGTAVCDKSATNIHGLTDTVYDSGNEGFQYYASTANPHHLPHLDRRDRPPGPGQPPVRPDRLLGGRRPRQPARRLLPQGRWLPARRRRRLRSDRRAALPGRPDQPPAAPAAVAQHRSDLDVRRF